LCLARKSREGKPKKGIHIHQCHVPEEEPRLKRFSCRVVVTSGGQNRAYLILMGVIKDRHGTYCARKTVPEKPPGLQAAVARLLDNGKGLQKHLKRSLGTKDLREANIRAKPVLAEFELAWTMLSMINGHALRALV
jgi:hypothetical protein